ncbi:hypothetical protein D3OALGA1CA_4211 [Olavius algarvensis associated proteobacterium Delta 3]|nr:hypothetical protein D3OALGB2SA_806 [Olavius algarvensis associated proteobacterium Delta 3]CAB5147293.1 hypothetical protein D3OALGA1CA_4211 [Olavius algarvensis associated proteobacterium Delta 3]
MVLPFAVVHRGFTVDIGRSVSTVSSSGNNIVTQGHEFIYVRYPSKNS